MLHFVPFRLWLCYNSETTRKPQQHPQVDRYSYDGPTMTPLRASARGVDPYPGLVDDDDDDDAMSSSSSAPAFEEARNCGSSQTQELFHDSS